MKTNISPCEAYLRCLSDIRRNLFIAQLLISDIVGLALPNLICFKFFLRPPDDSDFLVDSMGNI